jgi:hypothetical protein
MRDPARMVGQMHQVFDALDQLKRLFGTLSADVSDALRRAITNSQQGEVEDSQRARRHAARALFAFLDGTVYGMKRTADELDQLLRHNAFNPAVQAVLREEEYRLQDDGKAGTRPALSANMGETVTPWKF